jgi:hypothetical protein
MDDFIHQGMSPARRRAESIIRREIDEFSLKRERERNRQAMAAKTARLRELRLEKKTIQKEAEAPKTRRQQKRKPRRIKY